MTRCGDTVIHSTILQFFDTKKIHKYVPAEIQTGHLQNICLQHYHLSEHDRSSSLGGNPPPHLLPSVLSTTRIASL
jgi:hypothetical protein